MGNLSKITFRPCAPVDADLAVPLIYASGPDAFNYVFSNGKLGALDFLKFAFQSKGGEFSYDNHVAMIFENQLIGIGSSFSGNTASSFTLHDAMKIIKLYRFGAIKVMLRGLRVEQIIKLPSKQELALAHIAINENYRSKGYGQKLIEYLMSKANLLDNESFVLDVSVLNNRAKELYQRLGFETTTLNKSKLSNDYGFVADHFRMIKK